MYWVYFVAYERSQLSRSLTYSRSLALTRSLSLALALALAHTHAYTHNTHTHTQIHNTHTHTHTDEQINELIARTPEEIELFNRMDTEERAAEEKRIRRGGYAL